MPISDEALQKEKNRFIAVKGEAKVGQAVAAMRALEGQPWWHLIVQMDDGSWRVARFSSLFASLEGIAHAAEVRLRDAKELTNASVIERDSIETKAAQAQARKSPSHVLVVTANGLPVGILVEGVRRGAAASSFSPNIDQLGGQYVKLKDYSAILLGFLSSNVNQLGGPPTNLKDYGAILLRSSKK